MLNVSPLSGSRFVDHPKAPPTWRDEAACRDHSGVDFFPFPENAGAIRQAKEVCERCGVAEDCLAYALETGQRDGVWGGYASRERIQLLRTSRAATEARPEIISGGAGPLARQVSRSRAPRHQPDRA